MRDIYRPLRYISQRLYVRLAMRRTERQIRLLKDKKWAAERTPEEQNKISRLEDHQFEYEEWLDTLDEGTLVEKALKMGIYLDEIVFEPKNDDSRNRVGSFRRLGQFGNIVLIPEFRRALEKAVREREPIYKREKRESADFWLKVIVSIFTVLIGIVGALTGLIAVVKK